MTLEEAKAQAKAISKETGCVHHVELYKKTLIGNEVVQYYRISDWYDSEKTVCSYENGIRL